MKIGNSFFVLLLHFPKIYKKAIKSQESTHEDFLQFWIN